MPAESRDDDIRRIRDALNDVAALVSRAVRSEVPVRYLKNGDPTTALDAAINQILFENLPREDEGWLSEDSKDDLERIHATRVWVVDPIDGTREFVNGIPEWCVSIGLVEARQPVAGGILNPSTGEMFLGSVEGGLEVVNPTKSRANTEENLRCMLVSRREHKEGKWASFENAEIEIKPIGSIAYRLAHVAAGYAAATCTFDPRNEWDIAAGVALILAASGRVQTSSGGTVLFNQAIPRLPMCFAFGKNCPSFLTEMLGLEVI